jgi:hypothetical protein
MKRAIHAIDPIRQLKSSDSSSPGIGLKRHPASIGACCHVWIDARPSTLHLLPKPYQEHRLSAVSHRTVLREGAERFIVLRTTR